MTGRSWIIRPAVGVLATVLLAGCATGATTRPTTGALAVPSAVPSPTAVALPASAPVATPAASLAPTATPSPAPTAAPTVVETQDVPFESSNPLNAPGVLDIYAPVKPGPWPVVVMFHGDPTMVGKGYLTEYAQRVADQGFVVFVPTWFKSGGAAFEALSWGDQARASGLQSACAVAFARSHAAAYGGDPSTLILFGHSAGANEASVIAFDRPTPTAGCLGGRTLGPISALVTWEGDWLLEDASNDSTVTADPTALDAVTPWKHLAEHKDLPVVMLVSDTHGPDYSREVGDLSWLVPRDPTGAFRRQLQAIGAFKGGTTGVVQEQQLRYSLLKAQGNPVSLEVLPGSTHESLSDQGWKVFLAAFGKAASRG